ncbi:putative DNA binding domain-containing protein [Actinomyces bowdenii]|uniref:ATP-binding protein n=1 Tax=Actinomyces bowdenii TaxID=131109 RepID=UPI001ABBF2C6|nr:ATP-binding protein [Actinomyces bowdenii]MBO3725394.1 putative DNA binding domain-containing protein [Actinomyces bowdenii]
MHPLVLDALEAVASGSTPDSQETAHLDFKEDPARAPHTRGNPDAQRIQTLLDAAICFANADGESFIVLGVRDKARGQEAFTGTDASPEDIASKIFNRTRPNLTVEAQAEDFEGHRLVIIRVPQGLALYSRMDGAASRRTGTRCLPLSDDERHHIHFSRTNPDYTATPTTQGIEALDGVALAEGVQHFNTRHPDDAVAAPAEMLRRLGVVDNEGRLLTAAHILFGQPLGAHAGAQHLWRAAPGAEPERNDLDSPLIVAIPQALQRIRTHSNAEIARIELPTGQERHIRDFPERAVDEAVLNAFAHRDWTLRRPIVIDQSPLTLNITSPGGLPVGVRSSHLLTAASTPRNPTLMHALHRLGLVEETSRGFDRMWTSMLASGRDAPEIEAEESHVRVAFTASVEDPGFVRALALLPDVVGSANALNINTLLALKHLTRASVLTQAGAGGLFQLSQAEARTVLIWLTSIGLLAPDAHKHTWGLTPEVRTILRDQEVPAPTASEIESTIIDMLASGSVTNREIVTATGAPPSIITGILRHLAATNVIEKDPDGPARGPAVRWRSR